jgi:hypothetical protein
MRTKNTHAQKMSGACSENAENTEGSRVLLESKSFLPCFQLLIQDDRVYTCIQRHLLSLLKNKNVQLSTDSFLLSR